ncbi:hypothetical protein PVK06_003965 [Gossypium arboreum]|uniref:RRM domain-containing protein n=1 Tax=Gossypium arboreum TaxID=29729 RepID=A0ABR0QQN6_GOSAR|nr:hypothetical protein PVK06_003965 [Gossypium arboreum]
MNKNGKRFGFVKFSCEIDAYKAVNRLNGFKLYGHSLRVNIARYNVGDRYWKKVDQGKKKASHYN